MTSDTENLTPDEVKARLESALRMFAVYEKPTDFPDDFVVREWVMKGREYHAGDVWTAPTLEAARTLVPAGLTRLPRFADDDPKIVEVWL